MKSLEALKSGDEREVARLMAISHLGAVCPDADLVLQKIVDDVREVFGTDLCMINVVLSDVQYFRAWSGELPEELAEARRDPRERSMCQHVVETGESLVVEDFLESEEFKDQYFHVNYGIRFYAGTPLATYDGHVIGTLCLLNTRPLEFDEEDRTLLGAFGRAVVGRLELLGALERKHAAREEAARRNSELERVLEGRKQAENALERLSHRNDLILNSAGEGIIGVNLKGELDFINPAAAAMLGYEVGELTGRCQHDAVHHSRPDGTPYPMEECPIYAALRDSTVHQGADEVFWRKDGTSFPVRYTSTPIRERGETVGAVVVFEDITERKAFEERLAHQAFHDPLTGLPNRALFANRLSGALASSDRRAGAVAVLFLDLDDFKVVNDSLGHEAGDELLITVAKRLRGCLRREDIAARFGGDEFAVLIEDAGSEDEAKRVAGRLSEALQAPFVFAGREVVLSASIGIVLGGAFEEPAAVLRAADVALYRAKERRGKASYAVFDPTMNTRALERLDLEADLRRAIEREEFVVHYQPKLELTTGRVVGAEALVRWAHPERGLVPPAKFIPVAEETGLIRPIGQWVLREACRRAREWQGHRPTGLPLTMGVNLSAEQLRHPRLVNEVAETLEETGMDPGALVLEITESMVMEDAESSVTTLKRLKDLGLRLAMDDFGTGYSSLAYLKRFPIDVLKVDRSFIDGLGQDPGDTAIVRAVIGLARALDLEVVAEGIETAEQLSWLRALGCEVGQGYYFAHPLPGTEAREVLARDHF